MNYIPLLVGFGLIVIIYGIGYFIMLRDQVKIAEMMVKPFEKKKESAVRRTTKKGGLRYEERNF